MSCSQDFFYFYPMKKLVLLLAVVAVSCAKPAFDPKWLSERAPETYTARFETTKGDFDIAVERKYSPKAADRFYQLVKHGYFDDGIFYRVVEGFVAQFGNTDQHAMEQWRS